MKATDRFMQEKFDNRRFVFLNAGKSWQILLGAVIGSVLFAFFYYLANDVLAGEPPYRAQTLYQITFDSDQAESIHLYYNDYTWNDVLDSDQIAGRAAEKLGNISKEEIAEATMIPVMSDIRFIWVYVDTENKDRTDRIAAALEESLEEFVRETEGFTAIAVRDRKETKQIKRVSLMGRMAAAGAVLGAAAACFVIWYRNAMDDSVYTQQDIEEKFGVHPAGVIMKAESGKAQPEYFEKELKGNLKKLLADHPGTGKIGIAAAGPKDNAVGESEKEYLKNMAAELIPEAEPVFVSADPADGQLQNTRAYILMVPYGKKNGTYLELLWKDLTLQECIPAAVVIAGVDERFYRRYYRKDLF